MRGSTHLSVGLAAAAALGMTGTGLAAAAAGALLPDLDQPASTAGRWVPGTTAGRFGRLLVGTGLAIFAVGAKRPAVLWPALALAALAFVPHRGVTHSVVGLLLAGAAAWQLVPNLAGPFVTGYALHLAADLVTPAGVPLFWPFGARAALPLVRTGGGLDRLLGLCGFAILAIFALGNL